MIRNLQIAFVIGFICGSIGEWTIMGWNLFNIFTAGMAAALVYTGFTLFIEVWRR